MAVPLGDAAEVAVVLGAKGDFVRATSAAEPVGFPARGHSKFLAIKAQVKMDIELEANDARCRWCSEDR